MMVVHATMTAVVLSETYAFVGAHLPDVDRNAGRSLHGHTWTVEFRVLVSIDDDRGYAFDHARLDDVAEAVLAEIDHQVINEIPGLELATNEVIVQWLGHRLIRQLFALTEDAMLLEVTLGQLSGGRGRRLVTHYTSWKPSPADLALVDLIDAQLAKRRQQVSRSTT